MGEKTRSSHQKQQGEFAAKGKDLRLGIKPTTCHFQGQGPITGPPKISFLCSFVCLFVPLFVPLFVSFCLFLRMFFREFLSLPEHGFLRVACQWALRLLKCLCIAQAHPLSVNLLEQGGAADMYLKAGLQTNVHT